ncbi:alpha-d-galacturonidase [Puia sp. P3]|uniref:alpha-d-galacturonidase n=1 Tax=Puia sp. P3 TaxID=3423952 RepID=UPI003D67D96C
MEYGKERLREVLKLYGRGRFEVSIKPDTVKEGYSIVEKNGVAHIVGSDASGALYGCLELAERVARSGWPAGLRFSDRPGMVLRGACIGVQKPTLLPGRGPYEYPYTPQNFPWFYDRALWTKYLDSMAENRMNTLYLWNGHPFASLVKLKEYPYAVEVDDETFKKNEEMYRWLTTEADRRGIWVIQLFYNIIVSKPFAEKNGLKTQDRNRHIIPVIADYTRKSIAAFVEKYPNVGLMFTLGEAMEGVGQDDIDWLTKTIIPGIKDGLRALGRTDEPPVVLRAHDTDGPADMKAALPLYKNLYVEAKFNGEALTTYTPHGAWADLHRQLSHISKGLIENVHIMANLEPFRYGSADFIQRSVQAMHGVYGANSLHLYPQASYWDWPYSADSVAGGGRLLEMERDWIWYKAWARYAWNCNRDRASEEKYWSGLLAGKFGCDPAGGASILSAYEQSGEIAPKLLRRYGITDGNRQTLTLGMLMTQLIDPERYGLFSLLYESEGPPGEMLSQYAEREWKGLAHQGETPVEVAGEVREEGRLAVEAIDKVVARRDTAEFGRVRNDMYCYKALADCYAAKAEAALAVLRYKYSNDRRDLEKALGLLEESLAAFRELGRRAGPAYRYANSMQTPQRKIPVRGANGRFIRWDELLPVYEKEVKQFRAHLASFGSAGGNVVEAYRPAEVVKVEGVADVVKGDFVVDSAAMPYSDSGLVVRKVAGPLKGLKGIRESVVGQRARGTVVEFECSEPMDLLIGFFNKKGIGVFAAAAAGDGCDRE